MRLTHVSTTLVQPLDPCRECLSGFYPQNKQGEPLADGLKTWEASPSAYVALGGRPSAANAAACATGAGRRIEIGELGVLSSTIRPSRRGGSRQDDIMFKFNPTSRTQFVRQMEVDLEQRWCTLIYNMLIFVGVYFTQ